MRKHPEATCRAAVHQKRTCLKPLEERRMATKLHHVNLCSNNVSEIDRFYREVLDLAPIPGRNEQRVTNEGYSGEVAFVTDGATEVHLAAKDLGISFQTGQAINPVEKGHIAFRTDDIAAVKSRLKERGARLHIASVSGSFSVRSSLSDWSSRTSGNGNVNSSTLSGSLTSRRHSSHPVRI